MLFRYYFLATLLLGGLSIQAQFASPPNNPQEFEEQYQWRIRQETLKGVYIPKSLEDALDELSRLTDASSREKFASLPEEQAYRRLYHSLRLWIVTNWGLNGGSRLGHLFRPLKVRHPDDIAQVIIISWHRKLNGIKSELKPLVEEVLDRRKAIWEAEQGSPTAAPTEATPSGGN